MAYRAPFETRDEWMGWVRHVAQIFVSFGLQHSSVKAEDKVISRLQAPIREIKETIVAINNWLADSTVTDEKGLNLFSDELFMVSLKKADKKLLGEAITEMMVKHGEIRELSQEFRDMGVLGRVGYHTNIAMNKAAKASGEILASAPEKAKEIGGFFASLASSFKEGLGNPQPTKNDKPEVSRPKIG